MVTVWAVCQHVMEWQKTEWRTTSRAYEFRLVEIRVCAKCGMTEAQAEAVYSDPALHEIW